MFFRKKKLESLSKGSWLKVDSRDGHIFVQLSGRLDHTLRNDLHTALKSLLKHRTQGAIVLQLEDISLMDITIAATLAEFFKGAERRNIPVEVYSASPVVRRVFSGLGLEKLLSET